MLSIPIKRTESTKIFKGFEKYIRKNYDKATLERVKPYLTEGDSFRDQVVALNNVGYDGLNAAIQNTAKYYRFLKSIESRIPIASTDLKFTWADSITKKKYPVLTYKLEKIILLYNLGSLYSRVGAEIDLRAADAHKTALNAFQNAMGCLNEIRKQGFESRIENNIDLTAENISMLISILTAQCYLVMYDRLDKATANKMNLAKLTYTISKNFDQAYTAVISQKIGRAFSDEFKGNLRYQHLMYLALSSYWMSFPEREAGLTIGVGFGKGVARLRNASENMIRCLQIRSVNKGPLMEAGKAVTNTINKEKELAESENLNIYMDGIPDFKTLDIIEELLMVQPKFPPPVDIESGVTGQEVLMCLVPKEVITLTAEYKDLLLQMTTAESNKIGGLTREVSSTLESMGLPQKINALSSEAGLPEAIWKKVQQVQVAGGFFQLENSLSSLRQLSENCVRALFDISGTLTREEEEDKSLRQTYTHQWNRALSQALNAGLRSDIERYNMKLNQAMNLDQSTAKTWEANQESLQLLKKGKSELDSMVPANENQQNPNLPAESLKNILEQLTNIQQALGESFKGLVEDTEHDNITEALLQLVEAKLPKEHTFAAEIAKFNPKKEEINARIAEAQGVLREISGLNAEFERIKGNIQSNPQRVQILTQLEMAVKVYSDLSSVFSQGHQFYANLSTHLSVMQQKVTDFIYSRNLEKNELMAQTSGRAPPPGSAPNPYGQFYPQGQFK